MPTLPESPAVAPSPVAALIGRLHLYIGLFIGPFLLIAALSGVLYALTPQLEEHLYAQALHSEARGPALSLATQVRLARAYAGSEASVAAVRPAAQPGDTTRVMFDAPPLGASAHRAVFIDPVAGQVRGDLPVYGTSGVLPLRTWIDQFHRGLLLGDVGRLYSELAASWLWVAAVGGLWLWWARRTASKGGAVLRWHATAGLWLSMGLLFFSATGLTWSQYAGDNIGVLRAHYGWSTPAVATRLGEGAAPVADEHAEHHMGMHMPMPTPAVTLDEAAFDRVLATARAAGINAAKLEIRPSNSPTKAWVVSEIDRSWPTQVDAVAVDPHTLAVIDRVDFAAYSLPAKLTRWGIDAHMGSLFGLVNQLALALFASGLVAMVVMGYWLWWRRRPALDYVHSPLHAWHQCGAPAKALILLVALLLGVALPVLGASLVAFVLLDLLLAWRWARVYGPRVTTQRSS